MNQSTYNKEIYSITVFTNGNAINLNLKPYTKVVDHSTVSESIDPITGRPTFAVNQIIDFYIDEDLTRRLVNPPCDILYLDEHIDQSSEPESKQAASPVDGKSLMAAMSLMAGQSSFTPSLIRECTLDPSDELVLFNIENRFPSFAVDVRKYLSDLHVFGLKLLSSPSTIKETSEWDISSEGLMFTKVLGWQTSGSSGDDFSGEICIELPNHEYLQFSFTS